MWIATAEREDKYDWELYIPLKSSFKKLEVYDVTNDL